MLFCIHATDSISAVHYKQLSKSTELYHFCFNCSNYQFLFLISKTQHYTWKWYKHFRFFQISKPLCHTAVNHIYVLKWTDFFYLLTEVSGVYTDFIQNHYYFLNYLIIVILIYLYIPHTFFHVSSFFFLIFILTIIPAYTQSQAFHQSCHAPKHFCGDFRGNENPFISTFKRIKDFHASRSRGKKILYVI